MHLDIGLNIKNLNYTNYSKVIFFKQLKWLKNMIG